MNRILIFLLVLIVIFPIYSNDKYVISLTSSNGTYFKTKTTLKASISTKYALQSKITLDSSVKKKFGFGTIEVTKEVSSTGKYGSVFYHNVFGYKVKDSGTITVIKDSEKPTIIDNNSKYFSSAPSSYYVTFKDKADYHSTINPESLGKIKSIKITLKNSSGRKVISHEYTSINKSEKKKNFASCFKGLKSGSYKLEIEVTDYAENKTKYNKTVVIDSSRPVINIKNSNRDDTNSNIFLTVTSKDSQSGVVLNQYRIGNSSWTNYSKPIEISENCKVEFQAKNGAGLKSTESVVINNIDKNLPKIDFVKEYNSIYTSIDIDFNVDEENLNKFSVTLNDSNIPYSKVSGFNHRFRTTISGSSSGVNKSGSNLLRVEISDNAGNSSFQQREILLDNTPPEYGEISKDIDCITNSNILIDVIGSDSHFGIDEAKTQYSLNGDIWYIGNSFELDRNSNIYIKLFNKSGLSSLFGPFEVNNIDKLPPVIKEVSEKPSGSYKEFIFKCSVEDSSQISSAIFRVNGVESQFSISDNIYVGRVGEHGDNSVEIEFIDEAGNISKLIRSVVIDNTPPSIILDEPAEFIRNDTINFSIDGNDLDKIYTYINDKKIDLVNLGNNKFEVSIIDNSNGLALNNSNNFKIVAYDRVGNYAEKSLNFIYDSINPTIDITGNSSITNKFNFNFKTDDNYNIKEVLVRANNQLVEFIKQGDIYTIKEPLNIDKNGKNRIEISVTDLANNITTIESDITIDTINPDIFSLNPFINEEFLFKNRLLLKPITEIVRDNNPGELLYSFSGKEFYPYDSGIDIKDLDEGSNKIYLKAIDMAGNHSIKSFLFKKDSKPPVIESYRLLFNGNNKDTMVNSYIDLVDFKIKDGSETEIYCNISDKNGVLVSRELNPNENRVDFSNFIDGEYILELNVTDQSGNSSKSNILVQVDQTPPDSNKLHVDIPDNKIFTKINPIVNIQYLGDKINNKRFIYKVTTSPITNVASNQLEEFINGETISFNSGVGLYYLYTGIVDDGGNVSSINEDIIYFNNSAPPIPTISGVKKSKSNKDSINYSSPEFTLEAESLDEKNFIKEFYYDLYKGGDLGQEPEIINSGVVSSSDSKYSYLIFDNLSDNNENEYYYLRVKSLGNNGLYSTFTEPYRFRVDTKPPEFLKLESSTHRDKSNYYSIDYCLLNWSEPKDTSGIDKYRLFYSIDNGEYNLLDNGYTFNGHQFQYKFPLTEYFNENINFKVEAIDNAGNITGDNSGLYSINVNRLIPNLDIGSISTDLESRSCTLPLNNKSNIGSIFVEITGNSGSSRYFIDKSRSSITFDGLTVDQEYQITIKAYSNSVKPLVTIKSKSFKFSETPEFLEINNLPFEENINGFTISGVFNKNEPEKSIGSIKKNKIIDNDIDLTNIRQNSIGNFQSGISLDQYIELDLKGFIFKSYKNSDTSKYLFNRDNLVVKNVAYKNYNSIDISIPTYPLNSFNSTTIDFNDEVIETKYKGNSSWILNNITKGNFSDGMLKIDEASIDLFNKKIDLSNIYLNANNEIISGLIPESFEFTIKSGDISYNIVATESKIISNMVKVVKGFIVINSNRSIGIENLYINYSGEVTDCEILVNEVLDTQSPYSLYIKSVSILNNSLTLSGSIIDKDGVELKNSSFTNLTYQNSDNFGGTYNHLVKNSHKCGLTIYGSQLLLTDKGLLLTDPLLDLSTYGIQNKTLIEPILFSFDFNRIIEESTTTFNNQLKLFFPEFYGSSKNDLLCNYIKVDNDNIFIGNVEVTLPEPFASSVTFPQLSIGYKDGVREVLGVNSNQLELILKNGYQLLSESYTLANGVINFKNSSIGGHSISLIGVNYLNDKHYTFTEGIITKDFNSQTIEVNSPYIAIDGIKGDGILKFNLGGLSQNGIITNLLLESSGGVKYDSIGADYPLIYKGYIINDTVIDFKTTSESLKIVSGTLEEYIAGSNNLNLYNLLLDSNGNITKSEEGQDQTYKQFISSNNFYISPRSFRLENDQVIIDGDIKLPTLLGEDIYISDKNIILYQDGTIETGTISKSTSCVINGITCEIKDININKNGLNISNLRVYLESGSIVNIKDISLDGFGQIIIEGEIEDINTPVKIGGWSSYVTRANLSKDGIVLDSILKLPEAWGNTSIYLENLYIFKKSKKIEFTCNTVINNIEINSEFIKGSLKRVRIDGDSILVEHSSLSFPSFSLLDNRELKLESFKLSNKGEFDLNGAYITPLELDNYNLTLSSISINRSEVDFKGFVTFHPNFWINQLAGSTFSIKELNYNFLNKELQFNLNLDLFSIDVGNNWNVEFSELSISKEGFTIQRGTIYFPDEWLDKFYIRSTSVYNVQFDFKERKFTLGDIELSEMEFICGGVDFIINSAKYSFENGISFKGQCIANNIFKGESEPPKLNVNNLTITNDFKVKTLDAGLSVNDMALSKNGGLLFSGEIGTKITNGNIELDLSGNLKFGESFLVEDFRGDIVELDRFNYNLTDRNLVNISGGVLFKSKNFGGCNVRDLYIGIDNGVDNTLKITLNGAIEVPETIPGIGGEYMVLKSSLDTAGKIYNCSAGILLDRDRSFIGETTLKKDSLVELSPIVNNNRFNGFLFNFNKCGIMFNRTFPVKAMAGSELIVNSLQIDNKRNFKTFNLTYKTPESFEIFNDIYLQDGEVTIGLNNLNDIITNFSGALKFPDYAGGVILNLSSLSINSNGKISIDASAENISGTIFNHLEVSNCTINAETVSDGSVDFVTRGDFKLVKTSLPKEFQQASLGGFFKYNSKSGVKEFNLGIKNGSAINYEVIDGVNISLDSLSVSDSGIESVAGLTIADGFYGLNGGVTGVGELFIDWNGDIIKSDLSVKRITLEYLGMNCLIESLKVDSNGLNFSSGILTMPSSLGGNKIGIANGGIDKDLKFFGDINVPEIVIPICGSTITIVNPKIDRELNKISCKESIFTLAEKLGGVSVNVKDISITDSGLQIGGGTFSLPDFESGSLKFTNLTASLTIGDDSYQIGATGKVFIPDIGSIEARLSFVNIEYPDYPIGLEYAYFSFESRVGGIPLGTTGVFLTGAKGGLAFGPPGIDLPEKFRDKFSSGMRVQLGVSLADATNNVNGSVDLWYDVTNNNFALAGTVSMLDGLLNSYANILYTNSYGFEVEAGVNLSLLEKLYIEGAIRAHIFKVNNNPKFCGEVYANLSVQDIFMGFPEEPLSLGRVGLELGDFRYNVRGIKGYATLDLIGTRGFFYSSDGGFSLGDVDEFILLDKVTKSGGINNLLTGHRTKSYTVISDRDINKGTYRELDRIIFSADYITGDPQIVAISPSGKEFREGDENVVVKRINGRTFLAVINPEDGKWNLDVENVKRDSDIKIRGFSFNKNPEIELLTPVQEKEGVNNSISVSGNYKITTGKEVVTIYASKERGSISGLPLGSFIPTSENFSYLADCSKLKSGEYYIYAGLDNGVDPTKFSFALGSIIVRNSGVQNCQIENIEGEVINNSLNLAFDCKNSSSVDGFYLNTYIDGIKSSFNIGSLNRITNFPLSLNRDIKSLDISLTPFNSVGDVGIESNLVNIVINKNSIEEDFTVETVTESLEVGGTTLIDFDLVGKYTFIPTEVPKGILINQGAVNNITAVADISIVPGIYEVIGYIENWNRSRKKDIKLNLEVIYPEVIVKSTTPEELDNNIKKVLVHGRGFTPVTSLKLDSTKLKSRFINSRTMEFESPGEITPFKGSLEAFNPDGSPFTYNIKIKKPYITYNWIKNHGTINPGESTTLVGYIAGFNNFSKQLEVKIKDLPTGWIVDVPNKIATDSNLKLVVKTPKTTAPGNYSFYLGLNSNLYKANITVTNKELEPAIDGVSNYNPKSGETLYLYTTGMDSNSKLFVNSLERDGVSLDSGVISLPVTRIDKTSPIYFTAGKKESNRVLVEFNSSSYNIYPSKKVVYGHPGDLLTNSIYLAGELKGVKLGVESGNPLLSATLDRYSVEKNGVVKLKLEVDPAIKPDIYEVMFSAIIGDTIKKETIKIDLRSSIKFKTTSLKEGNIYLSYSEKINVENIEDNIYYSIDSGALPPGIELNKKDGTLYGNPSKTGLFNFIVMVENKRESTSREFSIIINSPELSGQEYGETGYLPVELNTIWVNSEFKNSSNINFIKSNGNEITLKEGNRSIVLDLSTGGTKSQGLEHSSIVGNKNDSSGSKFSVDINGNLEILDSGRVYSTSIKNGKFKSSNNYGILYNSNKLAIINLKKGTIKYINREISDLLIAKNAFLIHNSKGLEIFNPYTGNSIVKKIEDFKSVTLMSNRVLSITSNGQIKLFGGRYNIYPPKTDILIDKVPLTINKSIRTEYLKGTFLSFDSKDPEGNAKTYYSLNNRGLQEYKDKIALSDGENRVLYYSEDSSRLKESIKTEILYIDNELPETEILISNNRVILSASDRVSGIDKTFININGEEFIYKNPIDLNIPGEYSIEYWSTDRAGNVEDKRVINRTIENITIDYNSKSDEETLIYYLTKEKEELNRYKYKIVENSDSIKIISPLATKELYSNTTYYYEIESESDVKIYFSLDSKNWNLIGSRRSGYFTTPVVDSRAMLYLKMVDSDNRVLEVGYDLENRGDIIIKNPVSGSQVLIDKNHELNYITLDKFGSPAIGNIVVKGNNTTYENGIIKVNKIGEASLDISLSSSGLIKNVISKIEGVKKYYTEEFIDSEITKTFDISESGKIYGLTDSNEFSYIVNSGEYKVWVEFYNNYIDPVYILDEKATLNADGVIEYRIKIKGNIFKLNTNDLSKIKNIRILRIN